MYKEIILDYKELPPYINETAINNHLSIYKKNLSILNQLLKQSNYNYSYSIVNLINNINIFPLNIRGEILYYLSSILNHNLYFYNISNNKYTEPIGLIKEDINKHFGNYSNFKKEFIKSANNLKGSGYTFLVKDGNNNLKIINTSNEDSPYYYGFTPIIALDLWEHAYLLQYQDNRDIYINNFFNIIDFKKINTYYEQLNN